MHGYGTIYYKDPENIVYQGEFVNNLMVDWLIEQINVTKESFIIQGDDLNIS